MGQPWWDYWFPLKLALAGYEIMCLRRPGVLHLVHGQQTGARTPAWRELARCYAQSLIESEGAEAARRAGLIIFALSRDFAKAPDDELASGARDQDVIHLSELTVPLIATNLTNIDDLRVTTVHTAVPAILFENLEKRVQAGRALYEGLWEKTTSASRLPCSGYLIAAENAPLDASVLQTLEIFCFGSEVSRRPRSCCGAPPIWRRIWLAFTLRSARRSEAWGEIFEAISCFERALEIDPRNWACYYNLAISLYPLRRHVAGDCAFAGAAGARARSHGRTGMAQPDPRARGGVRSRNAGTPGAGSGSDA
jgi:tetratricopeptide (TPR) repeat protein